MPKNGMAPGALMPRRQRKLAEAQQERPPQAEESIFRIVHPQCANRHQKRMAAKKSRTGRGATKLPLRGL